MMAWRFVLSRWASGHQQTLIIRSNQLQVSGVVGAFRTISDRRLDLDGLRVELHGAAPPSVETFGVWRLSLAPRDGERLTLWPMFCGEPEARALHAGLEDQVARANAASADAPVPASLQRLISRSSGRETER